MGNRLVVGLALLMWHSVAHAASFTVTNTGDTGAGSLRAAITAASNAGPNTILITANGTIALASSLPTLVGSLTITGPGADKLTIQGSPGAPVLSSIATLQVSGVTITGGANAGGNGGGILVTNGALTLLNSVITGNTAILGGGIYSTVGSLTVLSSTISGNTGTGAIHGGSDVTVFDSTIAGNQGTAIVSTTVGSILSIDRSTISGNTDAAGIGGIQLQGGTANIRNTTFSGNSGPQGGDFWTFSDGVTLKLTSVTAVGGAAPALLFDHTATVTLRNTVLAGTGTRCSAGPPPPPQGPKPAGGTTCKPTHAPHKPGGRPLAPDLPADRGPTNTPPPP